MMIALFSPPSALLSFDAILFLRRQVARFVLRLALWLGLGLGLAGCAGFGNGSRFSERDVLITGPGTGVYKIGSPYQIQGVWYYPSEDWNYQETGVASWYGPGFNRKMTANGETYDQSKLSAAHRTLPMPCFVRVTNLDNGRSIVVRVNDRGPYARDRIIDVSMRGAQLLGYDKIGTARVRLEILSDESKRLARDMLQKQRADALRNDNMADAAMFAEQLAALGEVKGTLADNDSLAEQMNLYDAAPPLVVAKPNHKGKDDAPPPLLAPYANHQSILSQALPRP